MVRSNVKKTKRSVKFMKSGALDKEKHYQKKIKPVQHSIMDQEKRRIKREEAEDRQAEKKHQEDVERLKEIDPEFQEYLKQNEPDFGDAMEEELLDMNEEGEDLVAEAGAGAEAEDGEEEDNLIDEKKVDHAFHALTAAADASKPPPLKAMKKCVLFFRAAAAQGYLGVGEASTAANQIKTTQLFEHIVTSAAQLVPQALNRFLKRKENSAKQPFKADDWDKVRTLTRSYATGLAQLLNSQGLPDAIAAHVMNNSIHFVDYLHTHTGAARALLKACLNFVTHGNSKVQLMAFLLIRDMAKPGKLPPPFTDICMKGMYLTFVKNTRQFNFESHESVSFIMNECVELFGVDLPSAYQHIFVYIRQLAVYLRSALQSGAGEEAFRHVYNWQYINSLRLWAMTVARYNDEKELFPLVYPILQIASGVVELFPAPKTFPLHLIVVSIVNHLCRKAGVYVPVSSYLLRILSSPEFQKNYKAGDSRPADLMFMLRAKKQDMSSGSYQSSIFSEALYLLTDHLAAFSHTMGFPELAYPIVARLKKIQKEVYGPKWSQAVQSLIQKIKANAEFVVKKRRTVAFGPSDVEKVTAFEAKLQEEGTPLAKAFAKEKERRDETRRMRFQALKGEKRKTVDEMAEEGDNDESEEDLADLAQADGGDDAESEDDEGSEMDDEEMEEED
eukprot:TRINITY_DN32099_c0_g1_i1.p1 TRINITY_DN32099_c0_g1~~TRINITY_DN32099_c0_g1_i1.p1  ORF type:complete len:673 (+),score=358.61 TRINITY_DN32099_c0_g1_i1:77-2095(+)